MIRLAFGLAAALAALPLAAQAGETPRPAGAYSYIVSPANGVTVTSPVTVVFGLSGMGVAPAGVDKENTGHHHLLIDVAEGDIDFDNPLPSDEQFVHFGGGQTQAAVELAPGEHTLRLLLGDMNHIPHGPPVMSAPIAITVK